MGQKQTRRGFLKAGAAMSAVAALSPVPAWGAGRAPRIFVPARGAWSDPDTSDLARRAVDAAMSAGASYADARITSTREERFFGQMPLLQQLEHGFGVRVLVGGYWGFMSSAVWTADEAARLARGAVAQARANSVGKSRALDLGAAPKPVTGTWTMPVTMDPFQVSYGEKLDFAAAVTEAASNYLVNMVAAMNMQFRRQEKTVATSDGSLFHQTTYVTGGSFTLVYRDQYSRQLEQGAASADFLSPAGKGWEHLTESGLVDAIPQIADEAERSRHVTPVDVGRYDVVCAPSVMALLVDQSIGAATELDRAMGFEADADGSSYLANPLEIVGSYAVGSKLLNVAGNRSTPGGLATVPCDDEGVVPAPFELVKNGVLVDFQTAREEAAWLAPYYQRSGRPARSHGCARVESALGTPMQFAPNLSLTPGADTTTFDDLVAGTEKGLALINCSSVMMDHRQLNGFFLPTAREITKGKLGRYVRGASIQFRAPELWKNLVGIGGEGTLRWYGMQRGKGQPGQRVYHSVGAVPGKMTGVNVVDAFRRL